MGDLRVVVGQSGFSICEGRCRATCGGRVLCYCDRAGTARSDTTPSVGERGNVRYSYTISIECTYNDLTREEYMNL